MAQNYKVYFANRPVFFTQSETHPLNSSGDVHVLQSRGKLDTMLIENAIANGAKEIYIQCEHPEESWTAFKEQFEFVQAAGGLVINERKEMLFIFRHEKWDLPKGKVENGESIEEGALREVEEECSISSLKIRKKLCTTWHTYIQKGEPILKATEWYLMDFTGKETPKPQAIEGITDARWLTSSELNLVRSNTYASVLDVLEAYQI